MNKLSSLVLLLFATPVLADVCAIPIPCDKRINTAELTAALGKFEKTDCISWQRFPYRDGLEIPSHVTAPDDIEAPYEEPAAIVVDTQDCAEATRIVAAHEPQESDAEETERKAKEAKRNDPLIKELLDRIEKLEKKQ